MPGRGVSPPDRGVSPPDRGVSPPDRGVIFPGGTEILPGGVTIRTTSMISCCMMTGLSMDIVLTHGKAVQGLAEKNCFSGWTAISTGTVSKTCI